MSAGLPQHLTLDYLRALLSRGVEKTTVTEEARMVLRKWVMDARRISGSPLPASVSAKPAANETRPKQPTPEQTPPDSVDEASFGNELRDILNGVQPHPAIFPLIWKVKRRKKNCPPCGSWSLTGRRSGTWIP